MKKWIKTCVHEDDGWFHPSATTPTFSCEQLVVKYRHGWLKFGWKNPLGKWQVIATLQIYNIPQNIYKEWQIVLGSHWVLVMTPTIPRFTISIQQWEWVTLSIILGLAHPPLHVHTISFPSTPNVGRRRSILWTWCRTSFQIFPTPCSCLAQG